MTKSFTTRDGCEIHYHTSGCGTPLLLIHGWTLDSRMWSAHIPLLSRHFQVVVYDRRGYGCSRAVPDMSRELDDIDELLAQLNIDNVVLLGMSQGGRIALRYCLTRPERIRAVILQGASLDGYSPDGREDEQIPLEHYSKLIASANLEKFRELWLNHPLMRIPVDAAQLARQLAVMLEDYHGQDLHGDLTQSMAFPLNVAEQLSGLELPVLIIEGEEETSILKSVAERLCAGIRAAEHVTVAGGGHLVSMIKPELFSGIVIEFLQRRLQA